MKTFRSFRGIDIALLGKVSVVILHAMYQFLHLMNVSVCEVLGLQINCETVQCSAVCSV